MWPKIDPVFWDLTRDPAGMRVIVEDQYGLVQRGVLMPTELSSRSMPEWGITPCTGLIWNGGNCYQTCRTVTSTVIRLIVDDGRPALPERPGWYMGLDRPAAGSVFRFDGRYWTYAGSVDGTIDPDVPVEPMTSERFARTFPGYEEAGMRAVTFTDRLEPACKDPFAWEAPKRFWRR